MNVTKLEMDKEISPYLSGIQALPGKTPGEKFKQLNRQIEAIILTPRESKNAPELPSIPQGLVPLANTMIAKITKNSDQIIEGLKSDNVHLVNQALGAKFFFSPSNPLLTAKLFQENIMPHVSLRTRRKVIKLLSVCFTGHPDKAEEFFSAFIMDYGVQQATPLLISCSEDFIYKAILEHKIVLSIRMVQILYRRKPQLVIRYLQLGNKNNLSNQKDRNVHEILINNYSVILPKLVKKNVKDFAELYELTSGEMDKFGLKRTDNFIKSATNTLLEKPQIYLKLLNLKEVSQKLSESDFEKMLSNLFPKKVSDFRIHDLIRFLQFYPKDKKLMLLQNTFKEHYNQDIMEITEIMATPELLKLLSDTNRENIAQRLIERFKEDLTARTSIERDWRCYLPPQDSIPLFKGLIKQESDPYNRATYISKMIYSCHIYDNQEDLVTVLQYYNFRHKNEQAMVFKSTILTLHKFSVIEKFLSPHWDEFREMLQRAYVKNEFYTLPEKTINDIFESSLKYVIIDMKNKINEELEAYHNFILNCILEYKLTNTNGPLNFMKNYPEKEQDLLDELLNRIPQKYPENHCIWENTWFKINTVVHAIESIHDFNRRVAQTTSIAKPEESHVATSTEKPMEIRNYPWIVNFIKEIFKLPSEHYPNQTFLLLKLLKRQERDLYNCFVHEEKNIICNIENGEALEMLRSNNRQILDNWERYLAEASQCLFSRRSQTSARKFLQASKWYADIPIQFIGHSLNKISEGHYSLVLGVMLEGPIYFKTVAPYLPQKNILDNTSKESKKEYDLFCTVAKGLILPNPPVDLDTLLPLCEGDFFQPVIPALDSVSNNVPIQRVIEFGQRLLTKKISSQKQGLRLIVKVVSKPERIKILSKLWEAKSHISMREILAKEILLLFIEFPSNETWKLMIKCIKEISLLNKQVLEELVSLEKISKEFLDSYITAVLAQIEELTTEDLALKRKYIISLIINIDSKMVESVSEETWSGIFKKYFFYVESPEISYQVQDFVITKYLLPTMDKLESRLETVMELLMNVVAQWMIPHPEKPRYYPANITIKEFIKSLIRNLDYQVNKKSGLVIHRLLSLFPTLLQPWQEPRTYLLLNINNIFVTHSGAKEFGEKCSDKLSEIVDIFGTELILEDFAECLRDLLWQNSKDLEYKLGVVEGLMAGGSHKGYLVAIKILDSYEIDRYDSRYEVIVQTLLLKQDCCVQYNLNKLFNSKI